MKGILLDIDYETMDKIAIFKLVLKSDGKTVIALDDSFLPYFYVAAKNDMREEIKEIGEGRILNVFLEDKKFFGRDVKVLKVVLRHPQDVPKFRDKIRALGVEVYEDDILFARRYLIDRGLTPLGWAEVEIEVEGEANKVKSIRASDEKEIPGLKVLSFDVEVYNPKGAPRPEKDPIVMISLASNTGLRKVLTWKKPSGHDFVEVLKDEKAILKRFEEIVAAEDFDIIIGYNTDNFDFPYVSERLKKLDMTLHLGRDGSGIQISGRTLQEAKIFGRPHVDIYPIVRRSVKLSSYILEDVVREVLGIRKEKLPSDKLWQYWDEGRENLNRFIKYSMEDAEVTLMLGEKFLPIYYELTRIVKQPLHAVARMSTGQLVEWLLMREASKGNELIPNRAVGEEYAKRAEETYLGGYVKEPKKGISENIAVFDFRSLYPTVIITHNIDPSTLVIGKCNNKNIVPGFDYCFSDRKGFIPAILENLVNRRAEIKKKMKEAGEETQKKMLDVSQYALKLLANSFYGYMGYARARWYRKECAESVTAFARMYIQKVMKIAEEKFGLEVVYGDTDSLFVLIPENERQKAQDFLNYVNQSLPGIIELEYEGFYRRGIFVTKKRYALIDEKDKIIVKGLEFVRRDWAPIAKKTQQEVLAAILKDASPEKAAKIIREVIENIRNRKVSLEDITIYTQLTKSISSYKNIEPHVIAAQKLVKAAREVVPGMVIGYIITKGTKMISQRATPVELVSIEDYDPDYYIENQILPAVLRIIEAIGYSKDYLREGLTQESIKKWF